MAKIAIIGSGIAGMGAASLLHKMQDITLYEKAPVIGGHTRTKNIRYGDKDIAVDTGFIVFNYRNYPHLSALFKHLSVPVQKSDMTFGITINGGKIEWGARNLNAVFGQRKNLISPQFWRFLFDILRFNRTAYATAYKNPQMTLGDMLTHMKMGDWFCKYYILPMGAAIWSCPLDTMLSFPAVSFVDFFKAHGLLTVTQQPQWYTVTGGSQQYAKRLTAPYADRIRVNSEVVDVKRVNAKVLVTDVTGKIEEYDHVILACHADQALRMLNDATAQERDILGAFRYQPNIAVLHKDTSIMPKRKLCWSSWIYHAEKNTDPKTIPVTYWMNLLQGIDHKHPVFVTLNPHRPIAKEHIFDEHVFDHPVYTPESVAAQKRLPEIQGKQNTWFCGANWRNGFHEDGLASAVTIAEAFGVKAPWL